MVIPTISTELLLDLIVFSILLQITYSTQSIGEFPNQRNYKENTWIKNTFAAFLKHKLKTIYLTQADHPKGPTHFSLSDILQQQLSVWT